MLGKNSDVATRLTYLITWHCNEPPVGTGSIWCLWMRFNHFKAFMEKIHNLNSQSNKKLRELLEAAEEVGSQVLRIVRFKYGRVASSFCAVKAEWKSYEALRQQREATLQRPSTPYAKVRISQSPWTHVQLSELANLSQQLRAHSITLLREEQLLKCIIRVLTSFKDSRGEKLEVQWYVLKFPRTQMQSSHQSVQSSSYKQHGEAPLTFWGKMKRLHDFSVLNTSKWPSTPGMQHGYVTSGQAVNRIRDFLEHPHTLSLDTMHADHPLQHGRLWKRFQSYEYCDTCIYIALF